VPFEALGNLEGFAGQLTVRKRQELEADAPELERVPLLGEARSG
jgi:hypothetical protein